MINNSLQPLLCKIDDNAEGLMKWKEKLSEKESKKIQDILLNYPTVYIHYWENAKKFEIYIGETSNIIRRTKKHYLDAAEEENWQSNLLKHKAQLYIIGHEHFQKSLTLDIEHRLIQYMMSADSVSTIHNKRGNPQNKYYNSEEFESIFQKIWRKLRKDNPGLFPVESKIRNSAVFKASPLHRLTDEQEEAKDLIIRKVFSAVRNGKKKQLIFIDGEAGTGKTVLNSSAFYELCMQAEEKHLKDFKCYLMVNHDEQIIVYEQIAKKMGLIEAYGEIICKPTHFINEHSKDDRIHVAFIDEGHLLLTQGKQSYKGNDHLGDILERSDVVVVMFDENQILTTEQYWESKKLHAYREMAKRDGNYLVLKNQMRMQADPKTVAWIDAFTKELKLLKIPNDTKDYEIKIFECPEELEKAIRKKNAQEELSLCRLIATYDWKYDFYDPPKPEEGDYWEVQIGDWHMPWNRQLKKAMTSKEKRKLKGLVWAEQPQTIGEVGSTFTIQGFDLNYAGVILGPSVKYRDGKIVLDPSESYNKKAIRNRTKSDGTKEKFGEELMRHEVRVLMTRGIKGLYIYACNKELREALLAAAESMEDIRI